MVKHIKLFENWAEENLELPEYLDPNVHEIDGMKTLYHPSILKLLNNKKLYLFDGEMCNGWAEEIRDIEAYDLSSEVVLRSFSDFNEWREYIRIFISQFEIDFDLKLKDLNNVPRSGVLKISGTAIKSLNGLEDRFIRVFHLNFSYLENLKYCPSSWDFNFEYNPLLSYYGIKSNKIKQFKNTLCGDVCYVRSVYDLDNIPTLEQLNDPEFNANIFCYFPFEVINSQYSNEIRFNPWTRVYEDPSEVENYEFLFVPFYENSEKFRDKVKEYLPNANLSGVTIGRTDLW